MSHDRENHSPYPIKIENRRPLLMTYSVRMQANVHESGDDKVRNRFLIVYGALSCLTFIDSLIDVLYQL